jgi:hypothetical protein
MQLKDKMNIEPLQSPLMYGLKSLQIITE